MDMDFENSGSEKQEPREPQSPFQNPNFQLENSDFSAGLRAKSALRLKYEAETEIVRRKLGNLEAIRSQLGLSQRKMAQLLLVDPSAWTRWTKHGEQAPPHVYRMLQWYLALENKYPALDVNFWLNTVAQLPEKSLLPEVQAKLEVADSRIRDLESEIETMKRISRLDRSHLERAGSEREALLRAEMSQQSAKSQRLMLWTISSFTFALLVFLALLWTSKI